MRQRSICFVADEPNWSFCKTARALSSALHLRGMLSDVYYRHTIPSEIWHDVVFVFWWPDVELVLSSLRPRHQKLLCRVADEVTWTSSAPTAWRRKFHCTYNCVDLLLSSSQQMTLRLFREGYQRVRTIPNGVDGRVFTNVARSYSAAPRLGWCGNPSSLAWFGVDDIKGTAILKTLEQRSDVEFEMCVGCKPHVMPTWYHRIEVYVCCSKSEGTPLPVLEALASGCVVLSTPVGIVPEIRSPGVFIFDGTSDTLHRQVDALLDRREDWFEFGRSNRMCFEQSWTIPRMAAQIDSTLSEWGD